MAFNLGQIPIISVEEVIFFKITFYMANLKKMSMSLFSFGWNLLFLEFSSVKNKMHRYKFVRMKRINTVLSNHYQISSRLHCAFWCFYQIMKFLIIFTLFFASMIALSQQVWVSFFEFFSFWAVFIQLLFIYFFHFFFIKCGGGSAGSFRAKCAQFPWMPCKLLQELESKRIINENNQIVWIGKSKSFFFLFYNR